MHCSARALLSICTWLNVRSFKHTSYSFSSPFSSPNRSKVIFSLRRGRRSQSVHSDKTKQRKHRHFLTVQTVSHLVSLEVGKDVWRNVFITQTQSLSFSSSCVRLFVTLTSSSPISLSLSHTSQFHSVTPIYCVLLWHCLSIRRAHCSCLLFFLPLGLFLFPLSFSPSLLYSLHFSFKHLLLLTRTPLLLSEMGSGSLSPPPPTYHRVYYICHHLLLA